MLSVTSRALVRGRILVAKAHRPLIFSGVRNNSSLAKNGKEQDKELKEFLKSKEVDKDGYFIRNPLYTKKDFENSTYSQYMKQLDKEKTRLVDEKLKVLAESTGIDVAELRKRLDEKIAARLGKSKAENELIDSTIKDFETQLSLPSENPVDFVEEIVNSLIHFKGEFQDSSVFRYLNEVDPTFTDLVGQVIEKDTVEQKDVEELYKHINEGGAISEMTKPELVRLVDLIYGRSGEEEEVGTVSKATSSTSTSSYLLHTIFDNLNSYSSIEESPLFKFLTTVDATFTDLLSSYGKTDPENEEELKKQYDQIVAYVTDEKSGLRKSLSDESSPVYVEFDRIISAPQPIDLMEIYEALEGYGDYFSSDLFQQLKVIDPQFTGLLEELEGAEEDSIGEEKSSEIDKYLDDKNSEIYKAMNDVESESYKSLKAAIEAEHNRVDQMVSLSDVIEQLVENGIDSEEFKVIERIDGDFAESVKPLLEEGSKDALEVAKKVDSVASDPNSAIYEALHVEDSANHKVLEGVFKKEIAEGEEEEGEKVVFIDRDLEKLRSEDQSTLSSEVSTINRAYDLTIESIGELTKELETNTFEPIGHSVSEQVSRLLGFQPSEEQSKEVEVLKGKPLPTHKDEVLDLCVNLIMKDGKKDKARKYLNRALYLIYLKTRSDPVELLKKALDTAAPLVITKTVKTGFAKNYIVPVPLTARQRNRMAFLWILEASDSRASNDFPVRLAEEIMNVYSGNSKILEKRVLSHKLAIANRSYLRI
ncbi:DEKNAAC102335 [Brettanomyces naardenensis]|uniref:DEKNAAC102335 n=1 Tax=Brettanomyces naardenensis TaxID=13370 RepID=A0A448YLJ4_BRENA|nr:DEKNAAC102335 [Brettanomyces naardenensis]